MLYLLCSGSGVAQQLTAVSPFYHALNYNSHHFRANCQSTTCCSFRRVPAYRSSYAHSKSAAKISLTTASSELGTYPLRISRLERGIDHDREFAEQYRAWLEQQKAA
jgi:hypothetical protein